MPDQISAPAQPGTRPATPEEIASYLQQLQHTVAAKQEAITRLSGQIGALTEESANLSLQLNNARSVIDGLRAEIEALNKPAQPPEPAPQIQS